jgi:hypothetical protein
MYTGTTCFSTFDEACEMLSVASRLQMPDLAKFCHYHLWVNMYPNNVWGAYQCAIAANDTIMTKTALSVNLIIIIIYIFLSIHYILLVCVSINDMLHE